MGDAALAAGGVWFAAEFLSKWHHFTFAWVIRLGIAASAAFGLYQDVSSRILLWRWLHERDARKAMADLDKVKTVRRLPPWDREKYLLRKRELEDER